MSASTLRPEERVGLGVAVAAHVVLFAWLAWQGPATLPPPPERMTVTLSEDVGLTATAPRLAPAPAPDKGPELGEPAPSPEPLPKVEPAKPQPPKPVPQPKPAVTPKAPATPPKAVQPAVKQPPAATKAAGKPPVKAGASSFDQAFAKGVAGAQGKAASPDQAAAAIGPAVRSSLAGSISRQLKPRWVAPQGIDADKLVTILSWDLNPNGTLAGEPRVVRQEGITPANSAQAARHAEQAKRAVKLAAPFILPPQYYTAWKRVSEFRFDRKLSQ